MTVDVRCVMFALLIATVLGGCGGDSDPAPGPRAVTEQYFAAFADGNEDRACALLAPAARNDFTTYAKVIGQPTLSRCETALGLATRDLPAAARAKLRSARVTSLDVHGDQATATVSGATRPVPLVRRDGEWRIARVDFRYETFRVRASKICTRFARTVAKLPRPTLTRGAILTYFDGLLSAMEVNRRALAALGRPPERGSARDELLAAFAEQQRIAESELSRLRAGAPVEPFVSRYERRQRAPTKAVNAAQAKLQIHCGEEEG